MGPGNVFVKSLILFHKFYLFYLCTWHNAGDTTTPVIILVADYPPVTPDPPPMHFDIIRFLYYTFVRSELHGFQPA